MEGEKIYMSQRQIQRFEVICLAEAGKITLRGGAEKIELSYRQTKRIRKRVQEKGVRGLIHANRGNPSNHRMSDEGRDPGEGFTVIPEGVRGV